MTGPVECCPVAPSEPKQLDLGEYLRVLRRRKWVIVLAVLLVVGSALGASAVQTPVYEATAEVLLQSDKTESLFRDEQVVRAAETEIRVLQSAPVRQAVSERLGINASEVSADAIPQTEVFEVQARDGDPAQAAAVANAYVTAYIDYRRKQAVDDLRAAGAEIQAQVDALQPQIDALTEQISSAPEKERASVEQNFGPRRDALVSQQSVFKQQLNQLQVSTPLVKGGAQLINPATPPTDPVEPLPLRNGLLGLGVGLLIGISLAFVFDRLDDTIGGKDDLTRAAPGVPVIGLIPMVSGWRKKSDAQLASREDANSPVAEAYRSLRTSISFLGIDQDVRTIQVTSPSASEGKSATVANLALALSRTGKRVVVLSCDLRRPRVHDFFDLPNRVGFTTVLVGEVPLSEALQEVPGEENLVLLSSGPIPPNPSELLSSSRAVEVLTALQSRADVVLIDSAPVLPVTDAVVLASRGYPTLLIASVGKTTRKRVSRAIELLGQVDALIVGVVLNGVGQDDEMGYGYGYRYEQQASSSKRTRSRDRAALDAAPSQPPLGVSFFDDNEDESAVAEGGVVMADVGASRRRQNGPSDGAGRQKASRKRHGRKR